MCNTEKGFDEDGQKVRFLRESAFGVSRIGKDTAATPPEQVSEQKSVGAPG